MTHSKNYLVIALFAAILISCGGKSDSNDESASTENMKESCLADLVEGNEIEKMINKKQFAQIVGVSEQELETSDNKSSSATYSLFGYKWAPEVNRKMTLKTEIPSGPGREKSVIETKMDLKNSVSFGQIAILKEKKQGYKAYFRYTYGPKTKKEKEAIKKSIDRSKESSDEVDEQSANTLKKMVDKQSSREVKVGDLAYWSSTSYGNFYNESGAKESEAKIQVLHGNTMFSVSANVSDDINEDLAMAKKIAEQIIANCE